MNRSTEEQQKLKGCIEILRNFNEKLEDLSNFPEFINPDESGVCIHFPGNIERSGPEARFIYAVIQILRFFLIQNEDTSLRKMAEMYKNLSVSEETKRRFYELRGEVNSYLDAGSGVKIYYKEDGKIVDSIAFGDDGEGDSRREILDLFRFGYYEHMNGEKKPKQLASIKKLMPSAYVLIEQIDLIKILRGLIEYFLEIKKINEDAISELEDNI